MASKVLSHYYYAIAFRTALQINQRGRKREGFSTRNCTINQEIARETRNGTSWRTSGRNRARTTWEPRRHGHCQPSRVSLSHWQTADRPREGRAGRERERERERLREKSVIIVNALSPLLIYHRSERVTVRNESERGRDG